MTSRVTQCPKCQTSFRVTDAQLDIANGAVRCGSCLHIFNAPEHWLGETPIAAKPEPVSPQSEQTEFDEQLSFNESELLADDDALIFDELFGEDDATDDHTQAEQSTPAPISHDADSASSEEDDDGDVLIDDNSPLFDDDENHELHRDTGQHSIVGEHLSEDDPTINTDALDHKELELSDSFLNLNEWEDTPTSGFQEQPNEDEPTSEEAWAEQLLLEENEDELNQTEPPFEEYDDLLSQLDESPQPAALDPALLDILSEPQEKDYQAFTEEDEFILGDEPMIAGERIGDDKHQLLANIEPEPVEIDTLQQSSRRKTLGWGVAIIIGLLLLPIQFVYFNFDRLARDPNFRPIISSSCQLFNCVVPELHDVSRIRSSNLMVRSHPKASNALVVDAIITNRAPFKQDFPIMELRFTDMNDEIVAGRNFKPEEYLSGELAGLTTMPSQQPIHIALEIVDPGQQAVNYQLLFHKQKPR